MGVTGALVGLTGTAVGAIGALVGVTGALDGLTGPFVGAMGALMGVTGALVGATGCLVGLTGTLVGAIGAFVGVTGALVGATGALVGATGALVGATGALVGATGAFVGDTGLCEGAVVVLLGVIYSHPCHHGFPVQVKPGQQPDAFPVQVAQRGMQLLAGGTPLANHVTVVSPHVLHSCWVVQYVVQVAKLCVQQATPPLACRMTVAKMKINTAAVMRPSLRLGLIIMLN